MGTNDFKKTMDNQSIDAVIWPILSGKLKNGSLMKEALHHITAQEDCCGWWYRFHLRSGVIFDSTDFSEWQVSA